VSSRARRSVAAVALALALPLGSAACSETRTLEGGAEATSTTVRLLEEERGEFDEGLRTGSEAAAEIQRWINDLVTETDPCSILSQKVVQDRSFDPTVLASAAARKALAEGYVQVINHLVALIDDPAVTPALVVQRDSATEILDIVDRYAANPTSREGARQIDAVTAAPAYVEAEATISRWVISNCG